MKQHHAGRRRPGPGPGQPGAVVGRPCARGRTNTRPWVNLNCDPNDAVTLRVGTRACAGHELMLFQVHDDRVHTGALAQTEAAPDSLWCPHNFAARSERPPASRAWCSRTQRQAARAGRAAETRTTRAGRTAGRVRADLCASPPGAVDLGQVAQARVRDRHGALPELRWSAEDHRGEPGTAGDREDAHATWVCRPWHRRVRQPVGRSCKRPEVLQPRRFRRPGAHGCGDRLRQGFSEPRFGGGSRGKTRSRSPRMKLVWAVVDPQQAAAEPKDRISG